MSDALVIELRREGILLSQSKMEVFSWDTVSVSMAIDKKKRQSI